MIDGIGGTGVVTIGAILGMSAHLEGKGVGIIDMAGLAQKGGAVFTHMRIGRTPEAVSSIRVSPGKADHGPRRRYRRVGQPQGARRTIRKDETLVVDQQGGGDAGRFRATPRIPVCRRTTSTAALTQGRRARSACTCIDAARAAEAIFANTIAGNMFMLGFAAQKGGLPVSTEAVEEAIRLNGQAVAMNVDAFRWGRRAAHDPAAIEALLEAKRGRSDRKIGADARRSHRPARGLPHWLSRRGLCAALSRPHRRHIGPRDARLPVKPGALTETAARHLFRLMAVKDEFEVARLYTQPGFPAGKWRASFRAGGKSNSTWRRRFSAGPTAGAIRKRAVFGPWMMKAFGVLAGDEGAAVLAAQRVRAPSGPQDGMGDARPNTSVISTGSRKWPNESESGRCDIELAAWPEDIAGLWPCAGKKHRGSDGAPGRSQPRLQGEDLIRRGFPAPAIKHSDFKPP